jgi:protein-disulfide isomerase
MSKHRIGRSHESREAKVLSAIKTGITITGLILIAVSFSLKSFAADCAPLNSTQLTAVLSNLSRRWQLGDPKALKLQEDGFFDNTCYRRLTLSGGSLAHAWTIFLSPDARFVFGSLVDTARDPEIDAAEEAKYTSALLLSDRSPSRGPETAPIILVEFGDFQCPYCRQFAEAFKQVPVEIRSQVKLIYKHLPLRQHAWAQIAATASACAGNQSDEGFWVVHDYLLEQQPFLTPGNIRERLADFAKRSGVVQSDQLLACLDNGIDPIVSRDVALAERLLVTHTPTIFLNGRKVAPTNSAQELKKQLSEALRFVPSHASSSDVPIGIGTDKISKGER